MGTGDEVQLAFVTTMGTLPGEDSGPEAAPDGPGVVDSSSGMLVDSGYSTDGGADATVSEDSSADDVSDSSVQGFNASSTCPATYVVPSCGLNTPCDLRTNTCCVTVTAQARCVAGHGSGVCNSNEAVGQCLNACDCPAGTVCCGSLYTLYDLVETTCQPVPLGGHCNPYPQTSTQASAQLCSQSGECVNGQGCIKQTCVLGVTPSVCGLQSQAPFNCTDD